MDTYKVAVYGEHCLQAGKRCNDEEMIDRRSDDLIIYEGSAEELHDIADALDESATASPGPRADYLERVARTIREELPMEHAHNHERAIVGRQYGSWLDQWHWDGWWPMVDPNTLIVIGLIDGTCSDPNQVPEFVLADVDGDNLIVHIHACEVAITPRSGEDRKIMQEQSGQDNETN